MKFKTIESNGIKTISFGTEQIARCLRFKSTGCSEEPGFNSQHPHGS